MTALIRGTLRCLVVDALKLKRTLAPVLMFVLPCVAAGLETLSVIDNGLPRLDPGVNRAGWFVYEAFNIWCFVLLPLYVAVQSSVIAGIEHQNHGWRRMLSLPVPRSAVYASKVIVNTALLVGGFAVLLGSTYAGTLISASVRPDAGLGGAFPWSDAIRIALTACLAALLLLALHSFVSFRWPSFALNVSLCVVGIVGMVVFKEGPLARIYPWALAGKVSGTLTGLAFGWDTSQSAPAVLAPTLVACALAAAVAVIGNYLLTRRDVA